MLRQSLIFGSIFISQIMGFSAHAQVLTPAREAGIECRYLSIIEAGFLSNHIRFSEKDRNAELSGRTIDQLIKKMDPTKIYFIQPDITKIKASAGNVFDRTRKVDCKFLDEVQQIYNTRVKERAEFVKTFLGKDYKFDDKTEFVFDPEKQVFQATAQAANDYLKKYVHFQVANYLATDMKIDEAKSSVIKNYDRAVKRVTETKADQLRADYLDAYARALDPHSSFFSTDVLKDFEIQMSLSLEGIGATLSSEDGFTVVEQLVPGGAAARSGLIEPQDKIVAVGQEKGTMENVIDMDLKDVVKKIRGPKGTKVRLTILRKSGDEKSRLEVSLVRDKVNLEDEAASINYIDRTIQGQKKKLGVINFPSFYADSKRGGRSSASDMKKLIKEANAKKVDGLVLDLSTNGGGSLEDAVKIAGLFFARGNVVKQSSKVQDRGESILADSDQTVDFTGPMVVLTSRISASASEIVAGTLQDYRRAVVVGGDHTYGKGSIQSVIPLPSNLGAIKVTVGMFFIPGGKSTQHRGVEADIALPGPFSTDEVGEKYMPQSLPPKTVSAFISNEAFVKEGQSAWTEVTPEWIKQMSLRSQDRVAKDTEFQKINEELKKAQSRGKLIKVAEVLSDKKSMEKKEKEKKAKALSKTEKTAEYLKRPEIKESLNVLADLIQLQKGKALPPQASRK